MMPHPPESMPSCDRSKQKRGERGVSEVFAAQPSSILWRIRMSTTMQMRSMGGILSKQALIVNQKHFRHLLTTLTCQLPSHLCSQSPQSNLLKASELAVTFGGKHFST